MTPRSVPIALALSLLLSPAGARESRAEVPLSRVVLFASGVGYFEHAGRIEGDATLALRFRADQINDVLKSLVAFDLGGGTVAGVDYAADDPLERALGSFGVDLSGDPTLADLLGQLRGARVSVAAPQPLRGSILGVEARQTIGGDPPVATTEHHLTLLTEAGIRNLPLDAVDTLAFDDPGLDAELRKALSLLAESRDTERKAVDVHFAGEGEREVRVGYLVEAPVWKTSYRLDLTPPQGERPLLQGWAILENTTDSDWSQVRLSLVSGRPISFVQDLYTPLYASRPVVKPALAASLAPRLHGEGFAPVAEPAAPRRKSVAARPAAAPPAEAARGLTAALVERDEVTAGPLDLGASVVPAASGGAVGELFRFDLTAPVDLPRRRSAMVPIVNGGVDAEKLSIYNRSVLPAHPLNGVRIRNDTGLKLLAGPVTVFDDGSYAGDARVDHLAPGEERLLSYAVDLAVAVDPSVASSSSITSGKIVRGVLQVSRKRQWEQTYRFENKARQARVLVVEHPFVAGRELVRPETYLEKTPELYRFRLSVASGATHRLVVTEQQTLGETLAILDADPGELAAYQQSGEIPAEVRRALGTAIGMRGRIAELERQVGEIESEREGIVRGQVRLRENLRTVGASTPLGKRYLQKLGAEEDRIEQLEAEAADLRQRLEVRRQELADYLGGLAAG
jgi:hypothetical protein